MLRNLDLSDNYGPMNVALLHVSLLEVVYREIGTFNPTKTSPQIRRLSVCLTPIHVDKVQIQENEISVQFLNKYWGFYKIQSSWHQMGFLDQNNSSVTVEMEVLTHEISLILYISVFVSLIIICLSTIISFPLLLQW